MANTIIISRAEAQRLLNKLNDALDNDDVFPLLLQQPGLVPKVFGTIALLNEYLTNSKPTPLTKERTRGEVYAEQMGHQRPTDPNAVGARVQ